VHYKHTHTPTHSLYSLSVSRLLFVEKESNHSLAGSQSTSSTSCALCLDLDCLSVCLSVSTVFLSPLILLHMNKYRNFSSEFKSEALLSRMW
jgi:hypothetical protein